jgi:hypothetical protein
MDALIGCSVHDCPPTSNLKFPSIYPMHSLYSTHDSSQPLVETLHASSSASVDAYPQPRWGEYIYIIIILPKMAGLQRSPDLPFLITTVCFRCELDDSVEGNLYVGQIGLRKIVEVGIAITRQGHMAIVHKAKPSCTHRHLRIAYHRTKMS